ncbi:hypothetical protein F2Q69_00049392 [Brassica cretica]|uniref:Uncharacterized protein n=1 Tax=Brassica cretica TaxID=69181 RepID=A0A8S9PK17_BRACR|nr:hypothetical protein F2Q69_00049392 [Brassica cretica]
MPSSYVSVVESQISNATNEAAPRHASVRPQTLQHLVARLRWNRVRLLAITKVDDFIQSCLVLVTDRDRCGETWEDLTGTGGAEELSMMIETNSSSKLYNSSGHGELVVGQRSSVKPLANFGSRERRDQFLASWEDRGPEDPVHYWVYGVWSCRFVRSGLELAEYDEEDEDSLSVSDASMRYTKSKAFS